jgi:hypothetical protein
MQLDPVLLVKEILTGLDYDVEQNERFDNRALSADGYVWVQELTGFTPHIRYSDRPGMQVIVYSQAGDAAARKISYKILDDLSKAQGLSFLNGGIHRIITTIRPSIINLSGQPSGVGRCSMQFDLILSSTAKWDRIPID